MKYPQRFIAAVFLLVTSLPLLAVNEPVIVQAETGTLGSDFTSLADGSVQYVTNLTDFAATGNPGNATKVASYSVTFPSAGTYDLYARVRVGAGGASDDSFYYGNGFGAKTVTDDSAWILVNNISAAGTVTAGDTVTGGGTAAGGVWKWIKLSEFTNSEAPIQFTVPGGSLTQTFQIGTRENGLDFDQFAFGVPGINYTVANLNNGEAGTGTPPQPPYTPSGPPVATGKQKYLGGVYSSAQLTNFANYWNQVTPENAGKWGSVEATRDVMVWTELDAAYALAKTNGYPFRMHVLVWGNQQPAWIESLPANEQLEEIEEWFAAVAARYPDIDFLEVVNEPLHDPPSSAGNGGGNYLNALGGAGVSGWEWILNAFRLARLHFPDTPLMLNDYNIINSPASTAQYLTIINLLKAEGLIDIVGEQGHAFTTNGTPTTTLTANLDLLAATGLPIWITELDIDGLSDAVQLAEYQRVFPVLWEHPSVIGVTTWGYRPGHWRTAQGAYLALENGAERTALVWLKSYIASANPTLRASIATQPANQSVTGGASASFTVVAKGNPAPSFQWQKNGTDISGATSATLTFSNSQPADAGTYRVMVTNSYNSQTSINATLTVTVTAPAITTQPVGKTVVAGSSVTFSVVATGTAPLTYQWRKDSADIPGATGSSYDIANVQSAAVGSYTVFISNSGGNLTSEVAALSLGVIPAGFDVNVYLARNPTVAAIYSNDLYGAWLYYRDHGIYDGEVFDDLFRVEEYLTLYPELFAIFGDDLSGALVHWLNEGSIEGRLGRLPLEFSATGYLSRNPDVAAAVNNDALLAWSHYWLYGIYEGRYYDDELRVFEYLAVNADLTAAFVNDWRAAALHWMRYGRTEGRLGRLPLIFNVTEYLTRSPDVAAAWGTHPTTVFLHYWGYGIDEGRTFDDEFRPAEYLALNADLAAVFGTDRRGAFKHWVRYGRDEGRPGKNP